MNLKSSLVAAALLLLTVQVPAATATDSYQDMRKVFASPQDVQTSCYWYWISGNISKEGVINDLKSMKRRVSTGLLSDSRVLQKCRTALCICRATSGMTSYTLL